MNYWPPNRPFWTQQLLCSKQALSLIHISQPAESLIPVFLGTVVEQHDDQQAQQCKGDVAVSYTHLDVYKRQVLWSVLAGIGTALLFLLKGVGILLLVVLVLGLLLKMCIRDRVRPVRHRPAPHAGA